ncbi:TPA: hypothetical protein DIV55_00195 [Patescibacteria group bacterium]|uniref:Glycosyl transferase family 2 n=1 Tax=Candidatus Gottesmanbacteria bacterium GW2011_GWA1_43_11 TaxID=1618436 RepID=A0A0G1CK43_9BACT|nr:MAG: Glycosyl transferase family 2 [Candidatus Gottesmanbacteria bacterium GW2011_GWA1_43_11]HCS78146.1 hypothetical protein [Patescibacteria group bacterium]
MKLSAIILTKNETATIGDCLASLKDLQCDEILVIDDESTDQTVQIARAKKAQVYTHKKDNFAEARNFAATKAKGDWLLYIDADERLSAVLVTEIKKTLEKKTNYVAYSLLRVNYYLGKRWPKTEQLVRLLQKDKLIKWQGSVHETAEVNGEISALHEPLIHLTHRSLSEMVTNTIEWSQIEAELRFKAHHPPVTWWRIPRVMLPVFFDYYITQGGWQVGTVGLIESIYQAFSIFISYARLWEMQQKQTK